ncbi:hypothetical protein Nepgr_031433 [Nepenthes gracilis]|uniref:Uncharacterized protein n=1 Tax=Nepenthes gracilis TaxID=150966 RepID=A0AAD3THC9_NEPGR|nr:hypothetical protein Nepgr_031433 [Nepenthes gracilis]
MEVAEDGSSSIRHFEATVPDWHFNSDLPQSNANHFDSTEECERITLRSNDHAYNFKCQSHQLNGADTTTLVAVDSSNRVNGVDYRRNGDNDVGFKKDVGDLEELLSKLIPMAEEFMPLSLTYY